MVADELALDENDAMDTPKKRRTRTSRARLDALIEEATVDAYNDAEQATGLFTMLEEHLALPFEVSILGVRVKVTRIDLEEDDRIVAVCSRGRERQLIRLEDLPLTSPRPRGAEWIEAYRRWCTRR